MWYKFLTNFHMKCMFKPLHIYEKLFGWSDLRQRKTFILSVPKDDLFPPYHRFSEIYSFKIPTLEASLSHSPRGWRGSHRSSFVGPNPKDPLVTGHIFTAVIRSVNDCSLLINTFLLISSIWWFSLLGSSGIHSKQCLLYTIFLF